MDASIIVPTFNERNNLPVLAQRVFSAAKGAGLDVELIVVDDNSPDGTGDAAEELRKKFGSVKVIHRSGKLGLASAVIEGFREASANILGVIDADLSHSPEMVPDLIRPVREGKADLVFASRYIKGGGEENWPFLRKLTSKGAILLARPLTPVKDCVSGFFFMKKGVIDNVELNARGYKIGLEILVKGKFKRVIEVPYTFVNRKRGKSKLNSSEFANYLITLKNLYAYRLGFR
ncbi:MAG: polyprenol monophosphomannose synthase [Candidatus Altiarchaeota archaeon]|nr:polyprenol monophosphomannose synthase [Candidatus Altiarchaeota archaeon]